MSNDLETTILAGGCFWCTEAIFKRLKGVETVEPGYSGGTVENPSYKDVCGGSTDHAEAIQIKFDPKVLPFEKLLEVFFKLHDPTTKNQQGADIGTQYRSAIFYQSEDQKKTAEKVIKDLSGEFKDKIVTEVAPYKNFYKAENYHLNYFDNNRQKPYCQVVIDPKIQKLYRDFKADLKEEYQKD